MGLREVSISITINMVSGEQSGASFKLETDNDHSNEEKGQGTRGGKETEGGYFQRRKETTPERGTGPTPPPPTLGRRRRAELS